MDSLCQLAQSTRLDGVLSVLEVYYCALGNPGLARETLGGSWESQLSVVIPNTSASWKKFGSTGNNTNRLSECRNVR
jgi:hypothetical protein